MTFCIICLNYLKCGGGEAWAEHNRENAVLSLFINVWERDCDENFGLNRFPKGSVHG